jgi:hypothetical protein
MRNRPPIQVILAIMTTATIVVWVGFGVYQVLSSKPKPNVPEEILKPIKPELETETLAEIDQRLYFKKGETVAFSTQSAIIKLEPTDVEEKEGTESAEPTSTESAQLSQ